MDSTKAGGGGVSHAQFSKSDSNMHVQIGQLPGYIYEPLCYTAIDYIIIYNLPVYFLFHYVNFYSTLLDIVYVIYILTLLLL